MLFPLRLSFFFFNDTATTEIYTLSLHDALPIYDQDSQPKIAHSQSRSAREERGQPVGAFSKLRPDRRADKLSALLSDRKSTRLNSSHLVISYAVFCLKKKKRI